MNQYQSENRKLKLNTCCQLFWDPWGWEVSQIKDAIIFL